MVGVKLKWVDPIMAVLPWAHRGTHPLEQLKFANLNPARSWL